MLVVDRVRIRGIGKGKIAVAAAPPIEIHVFLGSRSNDGRIVLRPTVDVVGRRPIQVDRVELTYRKVVQMQPRISPVVGKMDAAVISQNETVGVVRIDPELVVIEVKDGRVVRQQMHEFALVPAIGAASVGRVQEVVPEHVDLVLVVR